MRVSGSWQPRARQAREDVNVRLGAESAECAPDQVRFDQVQELNEVVCGEAAIAVHAVKREQERICGARPKRAKA